MPCHFSSSCQPFRAVSWCSEKKIWEFSSKSEELQICSKGVSDIRFLRTWISKASSPALLKDWFSDTTSSFPCSLHSHLKHCATRELPKSLYFLRFRSSPNSPRTLFALAHICVLWTPIENFGICIMYDLHSVNVRRHKWDRNEELKDCERLCKFARSISLIRPNFSYIKWQLLPWFSIQSHLSPFLKLLKYLPIKMIK